MRDYREWHRHYDDPASSLSWRLAQVQAWLRQALDERPGPVRVLSACSGDGRDVLGVLAERSDADRFEVVLLELEPGIAQAARDRAAADGLSRVEVRTVDAGVSDAYAGAVPADVVLLVGIFGNVSHADVARTVELAPALCRPGAALVWSRGLGTEDWNDEIRGWWGAAGFAEVAYEALDRGSLPALGLVRYEGPPRPLPAGRRLFTFFR